MSRRYRKPSRAERAQAAFEEELRHPGRSRAIKFRHIVLPPIALSAAMLCGYSLLNWLLIIRTGLIPLYDEVADIWLPLGVSWLLVMWLIQPALNILKEDERNRLWSLYHFAAVALVAGPTMIGQGYIRAASGDITHLRFASEVTDHPATKYYAFDTVCVVQKQRVFEAARQITGGRNKLLEFTDFAAAPVCQQASASSSAGAVWIGSRFRRTMSPSRPRSEQDAEYESFIFDSDVKFLRISRTASGFFERLGQNYDRKGYARALEHARVDIDSPSVVLLIPHAEPFAERTGHRLAWTFASFVIGPCVWCALVLFRRLDERQTGRWLSPPPHEGEKGTRLGRLRGTFIPTKQEYGLPLLLDANILVFATMVMGGLGIVLFDADDLMRWGANYRPALHGLGWLRLITSQFVHAGLFHLGNNMLGLLMCSIYLAPVTGSARLIFFYVITGLGGSIASVAMHPMTISVGASGAIFGLYGILLMLLLLKDDRLALFRRMILMTVVFFVAANLLLGTVSPGIDNAAHVGGLVTGAIIGLVMFMTHRPSAREQPALAG